ncbi:MAG: 3-hydroxyacyl-CoA dehydrogenase NAD-binding domain-containing protein [Chitinophagales bacterium]|nr:3-hydroxyacyl-CoA dehydrogenase NAD-binding domain-containing protein [Chitinophagales bacterium]MDW8418428.1 3-hydroxyacyl-CoA dehydrogenase NAD-binding domain-containing protein [Chitinophagales bacterium]
MNTTAQAPAPVQVVPAKARKIKTVAVLGSGVMGSRIALHFANIGLKVYLLDIVTPNLSEADAQKPSMRNKLVNDALEFALKSNPSPVYDRSFVSRIITGNMEDNLHWLQHADWVIEVVVERLDIKKQVFEKVEKYRRPGTLVTSNTSGIPIRLMAEGRSDDFRAHFCGTHFFNPPRYLRLLEIIPTADTHPEVVEFLMHYGDVFLGKQTVLCKDTPAFIANRVGVFSIAAVIKLMQEMDLTIDEVDALTGTLIGKPKSATFRTTDVVGLDTMIKVMKGAYDNLPHDEYRDVMQVPDWILKMDANKWWGDKSGQGFFKKIKDASGKKSFETLDWKTLEYKPSAKVKSATTELKNIEDLRKRLQAIAKQTDKHGAFLRKLTCYVSSYVSNRIPEISDELYRIDDAMRAGFGWELGPFEQWDAIGVEALVKEMKEAGFKVNAWVDEMLAAGHKTFYRIENGIKKYYDISTRSYKPVPGREGLIILENFAEQKPVWKNAFARIDDIGDGVLNVSWNTKMNSLGGEVIEAINKAIDIAEQQGWKGVVLGHDYPNFSAGANLAMIFMFALEQEFEELDMAVRAFQNTTMRCRYSAIPVVAAPHGMTLGGGCEFAMHSDAAVCAAETYIGLVEVGVGLIPAGGGTKEMALRASDAYYNGDPMIPQLAERFTTIATAKVATSAYEGFAIGVLDKKKDTVIVNQARLLAEAKEKVLELYHNGYVQKPQRTDITVLGRTGLAALYAGAASFKVGNYATEHDFKIAQKIAYVMCGGDLSSETKVTELYLLDLEREAFLSLCGEKKTLERIQSILTSGKPLRN